MRRIVACVKKDKIISNVLWKRKRSVLWPNDDIHWLHQDLWFLFWQYNFLFFQQIGVKQGRAMEKLKMAHTKQVEEFSTDVQKVLSETLPQNDTVAN